MMMNVQRLLGSLARRRTASTTSRHLRVDQVAPWLFIGPALPADHLIELRARGVTHVVDLRSEHSDDPGAMEEAGLHWRRIPIPDREAPSERQISDLIAWLDAEAETVEDAALYLHCAAGIGRTPTVAIALLMHQDLSLTEAHAHVLRARPEAQPTDPQLAWLEALEVRLRGPAARGASIRTAPGAGGAVGEAATEADDVPLADATVGDGAASDERDGQEPRRAAR